MSTLDANALSAVQALYAALESASLQMADDTPHPSYCVFANRTVHAILRSVEALQDTGVLPSPEAVPLPVSAYAHVGSAARAVGMG